MATAQLSVVANRRLTRDATGATMFAMDTTTVDSSWVKSVAYVPAAKEVVDTLPSGCRGFLVVETESGKRAWAVPPFLVGLVMAAKSKGRAMNKLVLGKYASVKL